MSNIPQNKDTSRRVRRTKEEIEKTMFDAATKIIKKSGFPGLTVTGLVKYAKIEPPVFYNRYKDLEEFIDVYVRNYDYWLRDTINLDYTHQTPVENMVYMFDEFIDSLVDNIPMQKLIAWEMTEKNHITERTAQARDYTSKNIIEYFQNAFKDSVIPFDYSVAVLIGGVYYLIIHRDVGTFNFLDFSKPESIEDLKKWIREIIYKIFGDSATNKVNAVDSAGEQISQIALELSRNKVDYDIIKKATNLSDATLQSIGIVPHK